MKRNTYIYQAFERFWHWSQAALILFLMLTGFEMHGNYQLLGFEAAVLWHNLASIALIVLIIFAIFWHFVTGEWRQYIPTTRFIKAQAAYYLTGIFKGAPHPTHKTVYTKFNPLQRLIYLGLKTVIFPAQIITGLIYLSFLYPSDIIQVESHGTIAIIHTFVAFLFIAFVIAHIYLTTTGETPLTSIKAMITGWESVDVDPEQFQKEHSVQAVKDSSAGYYRLNIDGIIEDVNDAWLKMYRTDQAEHYLGKPVSITRCPTEQAQLQNIINQVFKGNSVSGLKVTRLCFDGSKGEHVLTANPIFDGDSIVGMEGFIIDLSNPNQPS